MAELKFPPGGPVARNLRSRSLPHQVEAEVKEKSKSCEQQEAVEQVEQETLDIASRDGFSVGQLVKARYLSGSFYTAKIEAFLQNGQIRIAWADGDANDRNKQPEELRTCDENGKILEEDVPQVEAAEDAKLTPAEREQAERIREFQRRQSGAASAVPQVRPKQQAAPPEMLDFNVPLQPAEDMQRLEEKLLMLSTQYLKLHEKITADTLASEKQMQELVKSGADQRALMTFRMDVVSKQSGQRLATLQIQEQISDLKQRLGDSRRTEH